MAGRNLSYERDQRSFARDCEAFYKKWPPCECGCVLEAHFNGTDLVGCQKHLLCKAYKPVEVKPAAAVCLACFGDAKGV